MRGTLFLTLLLTFTYGCSGDGGDNPQEPVAPTTEETPYPEDPDMAPKPDDGTAPKDDVPDGVGELTADPFDGKKSDGNDALADSTPNDDVLPPPDEGDSMSGALEGNEPNYQATPGGAPAVPGEKAVKGKKGKKGKGAAAGKGKQQRYVDAVMLNVRGKPAKGAPVVRRLLGGAMIHVELKGKWAKIKDGQWVRTKYLSAEPTRKVSRSEADKAWHQAKSGKKAKGGKAKKAKAAPAPAAEPAPAPAPTEEPAPEGDALPEEPPTGG